MSKPKVAVIKTSAPNVIEDIHRLMEMADCRQALNPDKTTILKDNISWHFPFLSANTTPWQLEGVIKSLRRQGYNDLVCVENRTVVTNAHKGETLNRYTHVLADNNIPVKFNFKPSDMKWIRYEPKAKMLALDKIFPEGIHCIQLLSARFIVL